MTALKDAIKQRILILDGAMGNMNKTSSASNSTGSQQPRSVKKVGRNDPCPCGSGKKYKKC